MQKIAKNDVFGYFIDFGLLDWSDIAYSGRWIWYSSTNGKQDVGKGHWLCIISISYAKKEPKTSFLSFYGAGLARLVTYCILWQVERLQKSNKGYFLKFFFFLHLFQVFSDVEVVPLGRCSSQRQLRLGSLLLASWLVVVSYQFSRRTAHRIS